MKILVVEDNPTNMMLATDLLEKAGHEVVAAANAEAGIGIAREARPDLILMDIQLPGMDGLAATRILKGEDGTRNIPIIALTAFAMRGDEQNMLDAGCDGYIAKPIRYKAFLATVDSFVERGGHDN